MNYRKTIRIVGAGTLLLMLSACRMFEPKREDVLQGYAAAGMQVEPVQPDRRASWWLDFNSSQLNRLMREAFAGSLTLEQSAARLEQVEALARRNNASLWPKLNVRGDASERRTDTDSGRVVTNNFSGGLYASYEVDLWGELSSSRRASMANYEASKYDLQTAAMTLSANLADAYFDWLSQNAVLAVYESQLESSRNKLEALELRYNRGQATILAVLQQRQQLAGAEARIPPVQANINRLYNRIAILTGRIPGTDLGIVVEELPELPPRPVEGIPVRLLANRPDVQAARLDLVSADANVASARAARLPAISLTGSVVSSTGEWNQLFDDWTENLAASLFAPIIDGGSRKADVDRNLAISRERLAGYRLAVLGAIQETENALSDETHQQEFVEALTRQYEAALNSEEESMRRYQRGIITYLDALNAINSRESLEISNLNAKANLLGDRISLYRALGGNWNFILEEK
ncbi:MAG: efflux transporter outer membrane subunit [Puniceicoccaceae bacterium]